MPTSTSTLRQLRPYEPDRERLSRVLAPEPPRPSRALTGRPPGPPLEPRQVRAVLTLLLEAHTGRRPASQLRALVHPRLYRRLAEVNQVADDRYTLKTVHACRVGPHAVEACGTAHSNGRAYAVVARFERTQHGWHCTFFDLIRPRPNRH